MHPQILGVIAFVALKNCKIISSSMASFTGPHLYHLEPSNTQHLSTEAQYKKKCSVGVTKAGILERNLGNDKLYQIHHYRHFPPSWKELKNWWENSDVHSKGHCWSPYLKQLSYHEQDLSAHTHPEKALFILLKHASEILSPHYQCHFSTCQEERRKAGMIWVFTWGNWDTCGEIISESLTGSHWGRSRVDSELAYSYSHIRGDFMNDIGGEFTQKQTPWT